VKLDDEQDIEELRRLARAPHAQNQQQMEALTAKSREVERLRGKPGDLQLTLKMLEMRQAKAKAADEALAKAEVARRYDVSQGAVYKLLHDARRRLKHFLETAEQPTKPQGALS
jgi:DNA-directed RNA polymerase specialized sigma24 family protein